MKITPETMAEAAPHIARAKRSLEMLELFVKNPQHLRLDHRVDQYYKIAAEAILELQDIFVSDDEYTEQVAKGLKRVNRTRKYTYTVQENNKGEIIYQIGAVMPLKRLKKHVVFVNKERRDDYQVPERKKARQG